MTQFIPRNVKDEDVEFPYSYELVNKDTGESLGTYNLIPAFGESYEPEPTFINKGYLQPIEDFLGDVNNELPSMSQSFAEGIAAVNQSLITHIADAVKHITSAERDDWNKKASFVTGGYAGTGSGTQSISLGFQPTFVLVIRGDFSFQELDTSATPHRLAEYWGMAIAHGSSIGRSYALDITSNGFSVFNATNLSSPLPRQLLNQSGTTYSYIALK